jgi:hypothetical protein
MHPTPLTFSLCSWTSVHNISGLWPGEKTFPS